ncbi:hypothetical protein IMZ29_14750 [Achromobacter sp. GG226]|uniref:hypothetical protein n=1 Tax=Verticiella alkaliphila TaxID=2779529 RepID=UPI001C0CBD9F|nr:hypothetical protein [Verticiella sp. GG226]MBU4611746.1 hypothetical protein [Verticiella sp. GG226]
MPFKPPWVWIREDWEAKQRRFREPAKPPTRAMSWLKWLGIGILLIVLTPVALVLLAIALVVGDFFFVNAPVSTPMTVDVSGNTVVLERRAAHIFLGEYRRAIVVVRDGREVGRAPLPLDSGGGGHMHVYQIDDHTLVLYDRFGAVALHLHDASVSSPRHLPDDRKPGTYLGAFDRMQDGTRKTYRFVPAAERPAQPIRMPIPGSEWPGKPEVGHPGMLSASLTSVDRRVALPLPAP